MTGDTAEGSRQRFGHIAERRPYGMGFAGRLGTYLVRDDETGEYRSFSYAEIVTEGFRTVRIGERVRYLIDPEDEDMATYVVRLDLPEVEVYYL